MKRELLKKTFLTLAILAQISPATLRAAEESKPATVPAPAPSQPAAAEPEKKKPAVDYRYDEMTLVEAQRVFLGFEHESAGSKPGNDPNDKVRFSGAVFSKCKDKFAFTTGRIDSKTMGLWLTDKNTEGRRCVDELLDAGYKECARASQSDAINACVPLSAISGSEVDLTSAGDVELVVVQSLPNGKLRQEPFEEPIKHKSPETIAKRKAEEAAQARRKKAEEAAARIKARNEALRGQMQSCRKTTEDIAIARVAKESLQIAGILSDSEAERIERELQRDEVKALGKRVDAVDVKDNEAVSFLVADLKAYAEEHPDRRKDIFSLIAKLTDKNVASSKSKPEDYDRAIGLIAEARDFPGVTESELRALDGAETKAMTQKLNVVAQQGVYSPMFWPLYQSTMGSLQGSLMSSCYSQPADQQACMGIMQTYQAAMQAPQNAWKVTQQQLAFQQQIQQQQMQIQQQMMQAMNGGNTQGMMVGQGAVGITPQQMMGTQLQSNFLPQQMMMGGGPQMMQMPMQQTMMPMGGGMGGSPQMMQMPMQQTMMPMGGGMGGGMF